MLLIKLHYIGIVTLVCFTGIGMIYTLYIITQLHLKRKALSEKIFNDERTFIVKTYAKNIRDDNVQTMRTIWNSIGLLANDHNQKIIDQLQFQIDQCKKQVQLLMELIDHHPDAPNDWIKEFKNYLQIIKETYQININSQLDPNIEQYLNDKQRDILWQILCSLIYSSLFDNNANKCTIKVAISNENCEIDYVDNATKSSTLGKNPLDHYYINEYIEDLNCRRMKLSLYPTTLKATFPLIHELSQKKASYPII